MYLLLKPNELNYFNLAKSQLPINDDFGHVIPLFHTGPESHELPRIDKYLDSCLNRTEFVKILTDSRSP